MLLPPSSVAFGEKFVTGAAIPPLPFSPWHIAHFWAKIGAPWAGVPLPGGSPVPSGKIEMSHGAISFSSIGFPRFGRSAAVATPPASVASAAAIVRLRINMADTPVAVHRPTGNRVEMLAWKIRDGGRSCCLAAQRNELLACRLDVATLVPGATLQYRCAAIPSPRHPEAGKRLRQYRLLQRRLNPAFASVRRHHDFGDPSRARIGDAGDFVITGTFQRQSRRRTGDVGFHFLQEIEPVCLSV